MILKGIIFAAASMASSQLFGATEYDCQVHKAVGEETAVELNAFSLTLDDSEEASAVMDIGMVEGKQIALSLYRTAAYEGSTERGLALQFDEYYIEEGSEGRWAIAGAEIAEKGGSIWAVISGSVREGNGVAVFATCLQK